MFTKKTKILATVGPASDKKEVLESIILNGADCIRLNFSHGTHDYHGKMIALVRTLSKKLHRHVGIVADIQGPKMRIGAMPKEGLLLKDGETITFDCTKKEFDGRVIPLPSNVFLHGVKENSRVFLDDGTLIVHITKKVGNTFIATVIKGGLLFSNKGINVPSLEIKGSVLNEKDKADITFAVKSGADYIALSFLRTAEDVIEAKNFIKDKRVKIIAKIERPEALKNIDAIIDQVDVVMIARGDLGIETPLWELPVRQKEIIEKVKAKMKQVIVATQMLDSMIRNPLPTRAEVSDVANAVYDSADAVMLSGESASGKNPLEAVEMMRKVLESTESNQNYFETTNELDSTLLSVARSAADISSELGVKAIFVETFSGESAKTISHFRPKNMIVAITDDPKTACQLSLVWGVIPFIMKDKVIKKVDDLVEPGIRELKKAGFLKKGDTIVCVYDSDFKIIEKAHMNTITVKKII